MAAILQRLSLVALVALLNACGSSPSRHEIRATSAIPANRHASRPAIQDAAANDILFRAIALVGTPYHFGGNTPVGGFDCSGLVGYVYRDAAQIRLPRTAAQLSEMPARKLDRDELRSADLVFFRDGRHISHVGIYVGGQRFVHAPNTGGTVRLDSLDGHWWREHFAFGKRVIR